MSKTVEHISGKRGLPPGSLVHVGEGGAGGGQGRLVGFGPATHREVVCATWEEVERNWGDEPVHWLEVDALRDVGWVGGAGGAWGLTDLQMEDVLNAQHRPDLQATQAGFLLQLRKVRLARNGRKLKGHAVAIAVKPGAVVTFSEGPLKELESLRSRVEEGVAVSRRKGAEYLAYRIVDTLVDQYFEVTETLTEQGEELESQILRQAERDALTQIQRLRTMHAQLRRAVVPLREAVWLLLKEPLAIVEPSTLPHWRDVHDHLTHLQDQLESLRDLLGSLLDVYANVINRRTNEAMQLMTGIATIFIPLTFLVGVYGMNFKHMPELEWRWGYPAVWCAMGLVAWGMYRLFRRRRWF